MVSTDDSRQGFRFGFDWRSAAIRAQAPVLRIGIALVFLWFGIAQLTNVSRWVGWVPAWITDLGVSGESAIVANGVFEILGAALLILGLGTRVVAGLLTLHMCFLVASVGFNAVGVRDFAIVIGALSIFLQGPDRFSLDIYFRRKNLTEG